MDFSSISDNLGFDQTLLPDDPLTDFACVLPSNWQDDDGLRIHDSFAPYSDFLSDSCFDIPDIESWDVQGPLDSGFLSHVPSPPDESPAAGNAHQANPKTQQENKSRPRFSREAVCLLRTWLRDHTNKPYPSDVEMDQLKRDTGLKRSQIRTWLANTRRRTKLQRSTIPVIASGDEQASQDPASVIDAPAKDVTWYSNLNPIERWQILPVEQEPVSLSAIVDAAASSPLSDIQSNAFTEYRNPQSDVLSSYDVSVPTMTSGTTVISGPSEYSFGQSVSSASLGRPQDTNLSSRKRRIRNLKKVPPADGDGKAKRMYQCTFCTSCFKTRYDWQRHEKSIHLSDEQWICAPHGPAQTDSSGEISCLFCGLANPSSEHMEIHSYWTCAEKSLQKRTFYRKDHLRQHLRLFHNTGLNAKVTKGWVSRDFEIKSRCGFCDLKMKTWTERIEHLAPHFEAGESMKHWKGDYGFEPHVSSLVENNLPLHQIAQAIRGPKSSEEFTNPLSQSDIDDLISFGLSVL